MYILREKNTLTSEMLKGHLSSSISSIHVIMFQSNLHFVKYENKFQFFCPSKNLLPNSTQEELIGRLVFVPFVSNPRRTTHHHHDFIPDDNECMVENGGCKDRCINFPGGFRCGCQEGYKLAADGVTCEGGIPSSLINHVSVSRILTPEKSHLQISHPKITSS